MFAELIERLRRHEDLTEAQASAAMAAIMRGEAAQAQIAGLLVGLAMKGERPDELVGLATTMREHAMALVREPGPVFDTCGTGGDRSGSFNISTASALVVASCGVRVAKHGNRSVSSLCGSADVLQALGVEVQMTPEQASRCLSKPASRSCSRRRFTRRCGTPPRRARTWACERHSICSGRSPTRRGRHGRSSASHVPS